MPSHTNRLIDQTSPYLLQHAHNPVDWWPWCAEALQLARAQDKPILLSVGYSACHWCHVMAHESFEDDSTAQVMNELFINIKVDREERPDLDKIYQTAHQLINQRSGGWPLTMILTPAGHTPFFAGTYFPVAPRYGMPAFKEMLHSVAQYYREHHAELQEQHQAFVEAFAQMNPATGANTLSAVPLEMARRELEQQFDREHGGFGKAPKFPHPTNLERLLRHWSATRQQDQSALHMVRRTLSAMAHGGIFDQLGGGFYRYSVDDLWMIPHFEKMLYDNGPLLALYADAAVATQDASFTRIVQQTAEWTLREMQSPQGGYYSSLDADSEGHEGKFYVWDTAQLQALLTAEEYAVFSRIYGLNQHANFEGSWHLQLVLGTDEVANVLQIAETEVQTLLHRAREKCSAARSTRIRPGRDEKILTAWNALMIKGMAAAGRRLQNPRYIESAQRAVDFIREHLYLDGRLLASYKDDKAQLMAYLDDYAFMLDALLECLQAHWRAQDLEFAIALADSLLDFFSDTDNGGFYFTARDHEKLLYRPKPMMDEAIPAGNAIAAASLLRLGYLLGNTRYLEAATHTLHAAWQGLMQFPHAHGALLHALEDYLYPTQIIILRGEVSAMHEWQAVLQQRYAPRRLCLAIPADAVGLNAALQSKDADAQGVIAYFCQGTQCLAPIRNLGNFTTQISASLG
jgi:hypothetical protein